MKYVIVLITAFLLAFSASAQTWAPWTGPLPPKGAPRPSGLPNARVATNNCVSPSAPARQSGIFALDGDFEIFSGCSRPTSVTEDCSITHEIATLQDNCVNTSWKVSHGTPEVCVDESTNNHYIHLWSGDWSGNGDIEGEGIFYECKFYKCDNYALSVRLRSKGTINKVYFYMVRGLIPKEKGSSLFAPESSYYDIPGNYESIQLIDVINNFSSSVWVEHAIPKFAPIDNGMQLWIFTEDSKIGTPDLLYIDDVTGGISGSTATCSGSETFTQAALPAYAQAATITASNAAMVNSGQFVDFRAGQSITLKPGFQAKTGSTFSARIIPCVQSNNCTGPVPRTASFLTKSEGALEDREAEYNGLLVFPSPTSGLVTVDSYTGSTLRTIQVFDIDGRIVSTVKTPGNRAQIDLSNNPSGLYLLKMIYDNRTIERKVIKE